MPDEDIQQPQVDLGQAQTPDVGQAQTATPQLVNQQPSGPRPILLDLIQGLVHPRMQAPGPGQMAQPVSRAQTFENFLGNFVYALGQGFANAGHGPGSAARGAGAAATAPMELQQRQQAFASQQAQQQAQTAQLQQQTEAARQMVQTPYGPMSPQLARAIFPAAIRADATKAAAQTRATSAEDIQDSKANAQSALEDKKAELTRTQKALDNQAAWERQTRDLQNKVQVAGMKEAGASARSAQKQQGLTTATRTMIEMAPTVKQRVANMRQLINDPDLQNSLGPGEGRWSEMWAGKIGATDPKFTALRSENALLDTALMRMHVGSRGGQQMLDHFKDIVNSGKQSKENMLSALNVLDQYADEKIQEGQAGTAIPSASPAKGSTLRFRAGGKIYNIPAERRGEFLKDFPSATRISQ